MLYFKFFSKLHYYPYYYYYIFSSSSFSFFFGCAWGMWKFWGQGSNLHHSSNQSHSDNASSFSHRATRELRLCFSFTNLVAGRRQPSSFLLTYFSYLVISGVSNLFSSSHELMRWGNARHYLSSRSALCCLEGVIILAGHLSSSH